ncbi:hypothetical protein B0I35DRAFT_145292 [Stachybotrys elegans]|uniref:Elongator complex protein 6 n=1 Tax=Stachybotrys elegans TaxID=80388 RepID=A0A8K0WJW8_9HYPO|nr:hypothetical protein B0I35DRAFT_145292 [Stachybotrys elegans]
MSSRIPPLLQPYLALPPEASLILLTNVLGATSNWLVLRYLCSYLKTAAGRESGIEDGTPSESVGLVLLSFLRDGTFWREGVSKLGLDLDALGRAGRYAFVDGLTGLFAGDASSSTTGNSKERVLRSNKLDDISKELQAALGNVTASKKILIIDQLDVLLAASGDDLTSIAVQNLVLLLREHAHAVVLTLAADQPLVQAQATTLERQHAALLLGLAHQADTVLALRRLDTGSARDVSGVVRITAGGEAAEDDDKEYLYHVAADGNVKVFERGA